MKINIYFFDHIYIYIYLKCTQSQKCLVKTLQRKSEHTSYISNIFVENRAVYDISWKNTVELDRPQMTIWRMRISWWIPRAKNTHSEYVILIVFPPQHQLHERTSLLCYAHIACLVCTVQLQSKLFWLHFYMDVCSPCV